MDSDNYTGFMALHSHPIVEMLAQMLDVPKRKALDMFYNSVLYRVYERENTKLWHLSNITLTEMLIQEIKTGRIEFPVEG